jgi:hypothetical protein
LFHIEHALQPQAVTAFQLGALILACSFIASFPYSALQGLGRFGWLNGLRAIFGTTAAVGAVVAVAAGGGIRMVFVAQAGVALMDSLILTLILARIRGEGIRPRVDPATLREMGEFGAIVLVGGIAYQWMINGPPLILAVYVSAANIQAFSIPHTILQKLVVLVAVVGIATSVEVVPSHGAAGAAFALFLRALVGAFPLLFAVTRRLLGLRTRDVVRALAAPSLALLFVTALYAGGAAIDAGLLGAAITGGLATAAYAAARFLWILEPREHQALRQIAAQT